MTPIKLIKKQTPHEKTPTLLDKIPKNISYNPIECPNPFYETNSDKKQKQFIYHSEVFNSQTLNQGFQRIKKKIVETGRKFNFTAYKADLWEEQFKLEKPVAYTLALLIPDIYHNPLTYLKIDEKPHLGFYLWGLPGDGRDTIAKCLRKQWLYSCSLSMAGLDSDVGVYRLLSTINVNTLLLATDIGTATKKLHTWQTKLPQIITNFIFDGYDVKHTKSEGSIECENKGVSAFMGGNVSLSSEPFTVRDVSRIIQRKIPPLKVRRAKMAYDTILGRVDLTKLTNKTLLSHHVLSALIMKGHIQNWQYGETKAICVITDGIAKKIGAYILRNYIPQVEAYSEQEIYEKEHEILAMLEEQGTEEDVNAIQRILAFGHMIVMDSCIDNLLNRPYRYEKGSLKIYPTKDDLAVMKIIFDDYFWEQKRQEVAEQKMMQVRVEKPAHLVSYRYYYKLLKEKPNELFTAKELYNKAMKQLVVDEPHLMSGEQFYALYGDKEEIKYNWKLRNAMEKLRKQKNVQAMTDVKPIKYCYKK